MSEHRRAVTRLVESSVPRRHRWLIGAVGALGASGLILGGVGVPVSAGDVNAAGNPHASADVRDGCVTAVVGTGGADGSAHPQQDTASQPEVTGQGTATVSVCRDDAGGTPPEIPGGSGPGDLGDALPGVGGGLVPDGLGLDSGILDRLPMIVPGIDAGESDGNDGDGPEIKPSAGGTTSEPVAVGRTDAERAAPTGQVPGGDDDLLGASALSSVISPGAALPRTGGGLPTGVLRLMAFLGLGRAASGLLNRRRRAGHNLA